MPLKWTNRSRPPSSGVMKPNPLSSLNHLTVPVPTGRTPLDLRPTHCPPHDVRERIRSPSHKARADFARSESVARELARRGGDLVAIARRGLPRQAQRVARVARDDVQVEVEHRLPR